MLAGDKSKPEMHLKQPGFTYNACGPFIKKKKKKKKNEKKKRKKKQEIYLSKRIR